MTKESDYRKLAQAQIDEWHAQVEQLKAKAKQADAKTQIAVHRAIEETEQRYDRAKAALTGTARSLDDAMAELKTGLERAWGKMKEPGT